VTSAALARISERVLRLGKAPAETMIAFVLFELCLRSSAQCLYGKEFHIPMTQQQLGDLCGLSAVHICRTLRRLGRNGVLSVTDHMKVTIHDVDELTRIADIDIEALQKEIVAA
jgi:CRP-like cAMP-binding protein